MKCSPKNWEPVDPVVADPVRQDNDKRNNIQICRTPQLVGSFEAVRLIEAEEKRKNKAEKGKRREELEKRKTNLQPQFVGCKIGALFTIKLGKTCQKCTISAHEMRCAPQIYTEIPY